MKNENIPAEVKSKSLKEARDEIDEILEKLENEKEDFKALEKEYKRLIILNKLESKETNLTSSIDDYKRLIQLNNHIDFLFKRKVKEISSITKKIFIIKSNEIWDYLWR